MFTYPGAPCLYYGDEIGMDGRHDPECRKSFPWDTTKWNNDLLSYTKKCIAMRQKHPALRRGSYHRLYAADGVYVFGRKMNDETLVIALNAANQEKSPDIAMEALGLPNGPLTAIFGEARAKVQGGKLVGLKLSPRSAVVLKWKSHLVVH
jgi:glycosidase